MKRIIMLVTMALMLAFAMALSGVALAQGGADVCLSNKGDVKVQKGTSTCSPDSTSRAVALKGSTAIAVENSTARATKNSTAASINNSKATATDLGNAYANSNCSAVADD